MTTSTSDFTTTNSIYQFLGITAEPSMDDLHRISNSEYTAFIHADMTSIQKLQSADYLAPNGETYCLMGTPGEYDLFILDEENEWELIDFDSLSMDEMFDYTKLCKSILDRDAWTV